VLKENIKSAFVFCFNDVSLESLLLKVVQRRKQLYMCFVNERLSYQ